MFTLWYPFCPMTSGSKLYVMAAMGNIHSAPYSPNCFGKNHKSGRLCLGKNQIDGLVQDCCMFGDTTVLHWVRYWNDMNEIMIKFSLYVVQCHCDTVHFHQNTHNRLNHLPVRQRYGVSFVSLTCDLCSTLLVIAVLYAISCCVG